MNHYYRLNPEVAGGFGDRAELDSTVHPPVVRRLHYEVADWLGDCLVQTFPCFLVLRAVGAALEKAGLGGFALAEAEVTEADIFQDLNPGGALPDLVWLKVSGTAGSEDFGVSSDNRLVVSERALAMLRPAGLAHCGVEVY
ncbi:hypothetical protein ACFVYD_35855 [Streptomyces sp. NPDC058301]|uniref:hypothetical protein n=1 Tax=Streptomyces sp. NPDC058301 TaxID=3346436 RepID=UPI0036E9D499